MKRVSFALFAILLLAAPAARNETTGLEFLAVCVGSVLKAIIVEVPGPGRLTIPIRPDLCADDKPRRPARTT